VAPDDPEHRHTQDHAAGTGEEPVAPRGHRRPGADHAQRAHQAEDPHPPEVALEEGTHLDQPHDDPGHARQRQGEPGRRGQAPPLPGQDQVGEAGASQDQGAEGGRVDGRDQPQPGQDLPAMRGELLPAAVAGHLVLVVQPAAERTDLVLVEGVLDRVAGGVAPVLPGLHPAHEPPSQADLVEAQARSHGDDVIDPVGLLPLRGSVGCHEATVPRPPGPGRGPRGAC
jgi:hypothetical protein